jgi:hypothetical protein
MPVLSDPYGELPLRNDKYASLCSELHLSKRNINILANFNAFTQLSTLWVNNNKLKKLEGLDKNVRLRNLHAHGNRITKLEGSSLAFFKFLEYLTLNDNLLESIADVVGEMKHLRNLKNLDLFGNPISQEDNYRLLVISEIPWLKTLDRVAITKTELNEAMHLKNRLKRMMVLKMSNKLGAADSDGKSSVCNNEELLDDLIPYIKNTLRSKRVILEERFLQDDPRKTGMVNMGVFQAALKQYGIVDIMSEDELTALTDRYKAVLKIKGISATNSFSREMINYRKFCDDFLSTGLRIQNPSFQKLDTWKMEMVPEISVTAKDLRRYVNTNTVAKEAALRKTKREALFAGSSSMESNSKFSFHTSINEDDRNQNISESWSRYMLHQFVLEEINKAASTEGTYSSVSLACSAQIEFSKMQVMFLFERMSNHGKVPTVAVDKCLRDIFQAEDTVSLATLWRFLGPENGGAPGRVEWRDLSEEEMGSKEVLVFEEAGALLDSLLRSSSAGDSEAQAKHNSLLSSTISAATTGTRMAATKRVRYGCS